MGTSRVTLARGGNDPNLTRIVVNQGGPGTTLLFGAVADKRHKIVGALLTLSADGTLEFKSGSTSMNGPFDIAAKGGFSHESDAPFFECGLTEDLNLVTTGGAARGVVLIVTE
jgi:hypothetical protein